MVSNNLEEALVTQLKKLALCGLLNSVEYYGCKLFGNGIRLTLFLAAGVLLFLVLYEILLLEITDIN